MKARHEKRLIHPWSPEYSAFSRQSRKGVSLPAVPSRERCRRYRLKFPERVLASHRRWYWTHHDEVRTRENANRRTPSFRARNREYMRRKYHDKHPDWVPKEIISLQAREFEQLMIDLRREGHTWPEIAGMTRRSANSCASAHRRAAHRLGLTLQRRSSSVDDALILATYHDGMMWTELAQRLGFSGPTPAKRAYLRALERRQQTDCEVAS